MKLFERKPTAQETLTKLCKTMELEVIAEPMGFVWLSGYDFAIGCNHATTEQLIQFANEIAEYRTRIDLYPWQQIKDKTK